MLYTVNSKDIKNLIFSNIISRTIAHTPGMENFTFSLPTNKVVANFIGLSYDRVNNFLEQGSEAGTESHMLIKSVLKSIDKRVDKFSLENIHIELSEELSDEQVALSAYRKMVALEAEEEKEEDGNPFGETVTEDEVDDKVEKDESTIAVMVAELIKEIVNTDASEVTDLAERVVELSKENNDMKKEIAEDDEDMFSTVDDEDDEDSGKGNPFDDDKEDNSKDDNKDDSKGNPFEDEVDSKEDSDNDNGNPFDDDEEKEGSEKKPKDNPFDDDKEEKDNKDDDDKTGEENQTKKLIKNLEIRSFGLEKEIYQDVKRFNPFVGLENDSFNNLAKFVADKLEGEDLYSAYTNFGVESEAYTNAKQVYSKTAKETMSAGIGAILMASILNIPVESHKLNNIELFAE